MIIHTKYTGRRQNDFNVCAYAADICDDCCDDQPDISAMAQIYNILKTIDPYHLVTGAVNCDDVW